MRKHLPEKSRSRRAEIRKNRPDIAWPRWEELRQRGIPASIGIGVAFCALAIVIVMFRQDVVPYRPGQAIPHDMMSRVGFYHYDQAKLKRAQQDAHDNEPRVYTAAGDVWAPLQKQLADLPNEIINQRDDASELIPGGIQPGEVTALASDATGIDNKDYLAAIDRLIAALRDKPVLAGAQKLPLVLIARDALKEDIAAHRDIRVGGILYSTDHVFALPSPELKSLLVKMAAAQGLAEVEQPLASFAMSKLSANYQLDVNASWAAAVDAQNRVPAAVGRMHYSADSPLVVRAQKKVFDYQDWQLLREENDAYVASIGDASWKEKAGLAGLVLLITIALGAYVARYQPKVQKNHARAVGISALLLSMLLLAQIAGIGYEPLYLFGIAPTLLVAMILTIAYDSRFAIGVACLHGALATLALDQGIAFFIVICVGVLTASLLLDDIRTRSKLIEVGGATALALMLATAAASALSLNPLLFVIKSALYAGAAGLSVGFIVLGILPFVEKMFRITTSMTLLELADVSQPLLRRLAEEAPGTYNHSLQVATLAERSAEAIGGNALLCRVASYYHDVGKINKPDYFIENQSNGENRHLNLNPSVSLMIIIGHVKDGIELAREYNLPTSVIPFIQQHHGTTLVEYFYHQACTRHERDDPDSPAVADHEYRYPGPRPRSREVAVVMIADAVESATRAMREPTGSRVEALVHDLIMKRLTDGQFGECDLTLRDLERIERTMIKTILGIYHGRIAYPSTAAIATPTEAPALTEPDAQVRTA